MSKIYANTLKSLLLLLPFSTFAQKEVPVTPTPSAKRIAGFDERKKLDDNSLVSNIKFRNVGPSVMSGRVVDVDVSPTDPTHFYVAYASGGLWVTYNNGQSFTPLFDNQVVMTIGDIAVDWKHGEVIWVGTGENNSSRSSYAGVGIYKSTDKGKRWVYKGLGESQHIGRIVLDPNDTNTVNVAVLGHLYTPNEERGMYKTTDGGKTWKKTLYIDNNTGAIDLTMDPTNPKILYAAMWHRARRAWNFEGSGSTSGIYKSTDGGETWSLLTTKESGFPTGNGVGRIGLAVYPKNPNIVYAVLDNQADRGIKKKKEGLTKDTLRTMTKAAFLTLSDSVLEKFLRDNNFDDEYTGERVMKMVKADSIKPSSLVDYLEDAETAISETNVKGVEVYRSDDAGKTWKRTHEGYLDEVVNTYGYYFGQIRVSPFNPDKIFIVGVPILKSVDGGKTFRSIDAGN
ncbi:MAG TPA: glycosyl hydrolase, partial [Bacteroidia bacterium]|nr:glycosyl hydrolase [Bacteroidia bacterium]